MVYKVLKNFKCRFQNFALFKSGEKYNSVNEKHTEKLIRLGFIEESVNSADQDGENNEKVVQKTKRTRKNTVVVDRDE